VYVDWDHGDCDRPLIVGRAYNGKVQPAWHTNGILSGYRSKEYFGAGYNQLVMDDATGQNRVQLFSSTANTQLHLGYLIDQSGNTRGAHLGQGFDLKSEMYGAVRAGQGLYMSTHPTASSSQPMDVSPARQQLEGATNVADALSQASTANQAESLQPAVDALKAYGQSTQHTVSGNSSDGLTAGGGQGDANGFAEPALLIASPAGIALSSQKSVHVTADEHVNLVSHLNTHVATGKSLIASVGEKISLFVQNAGIKLFAAKGPVDIEAQSDAMTLASQQDLTLTSVDGRIVVEAEKEVWLGAGGSYIKINAQTIENGTAGKILERAAQWSKQGASSMRLPAQITSASKGCSWKTAGASADSASSVVLG
jgi:type VI secretion system secreted protein VgrG